MKSIILAAGLLALAVQSPVPDGSTAPGDHLVLELRQYKIVAGKRDAFVDFFERHFIESQEALGMKLVGQFRDRADASRFVWLRQFSSMAVRAKALADFYTGPVWQEYRGIANPMLDDNDNVLLLKPAWPGAGLAPASGPRAVPGADVTAGDTIVVTIEYLWKDPAQGYAAHFHDRLMSLYRAAGLTVLGAYIPEDQSNNFPRLYVREKERVLVWFTRAKNPEAYAAAMRKLGALPEWRRSLASMQNDYLERGPQVLFLAPTPRSLLR